MIFKIEINLTNNFLSRSSNPRLFGASPISRSIILSSTCWIVVYIFATLAFWQVHPDLPGADLQLLIIIITIVTVEEKKIKT